MKYQSFAQSKRQHQYLNLPGEFKSRLPQEMVFTDMTSARADELYCNDENLLINLEEESDYLDSKSFNKFAKYVIFIAYWYLKRKPLRFYHITPVIIDELSFFDIIPVRNDSPLC